jgi:hypothetical protein
MHVHTQKADIKYCWASTLTEHGLNRAYHTVSLIQQICHHMPVAHFSSESPDENVPGRFECGHQRNMARLCSSQVYHYKAV